MVVFYKSIKAVTAMLPSLGNSISPTTLDVSDAGMSLSAISALKGQKKKHTDRVSTLVSIKSVASTLAFGAIKYYDGNLTTTKAVSLSKPLINRSLNTHLPNSVPRRSS